MPWCNSAQTWRRWPCWMSLQRFEQESGRVRLRHWGERTLDLDLLIYAEENSA